jgi:hypothetical protein
MISICRLCSQGIFGSALSSIEYCEVGFAERYRRGSFPTSEVPGWKKNDDRAEHHAGERLSLAYHVKYRIANSFVVERTLLLQSKSGPR